MVTVFVKEKSFLISGRTVGQEEGSVSKGTWHQVWPKFDPETLESVWWKELTPASCPFGLDMPWGLHVPTLPSNKQTNSFKAIKILKGTREMV